MCISPPSLIIPLIQVWQGTAAGRSSPPLFPYSWCFLRLDFNQLYPEMSELCRSVHNLNHLMSIQVEWGLQGETRKPWAFYRNKTIWQTIQSDIWKSNPSMGCLQGQAVLLDTLSATNGTLVYLQLLGLELCNFMILPNDTMMDEFNSYLETELLQLI